MIMSGVASYTVPGLFHQIFWARHLARLAGGMARFPELRWGARLETQVLRDLPQHRGQARSGISSRLGEKDSTKLQQALLFFAIFGCKFRKIFYEGMVQRD